MRHLVVAVTISRDCTAGLCLDRLPNRRACGESGEGRPSREHHERNEEEIYYVEEIAPLLRRVDMGCGSWKRSSADRDKCRE